MTTVGVADAAKTKKGKDASKKTNNTRPAATGGDEEDAEPITLCSGISEEFYVCPLDDCRFCVCPSCYGSFTGKLKSKARSQMYSFHKYGIWPYVGMLAVIAAQSVYLPVVRTALMVVACHPSYWCRFPSCLGEEPSASYIVLSVLAIAIVAIVGIGMIVLFFVLLQRRWGLAGREFASLSRAEAVSCHVTSSSVTSPQPRSVADKSYFHKDDEMNGEAQKNTASPVSDGSLLGQQQQRSSSGEDPQRRQQQEGEIGSARERWWSDVIQRDRSLLRGVYSPYSFDGMRLYPLVLLLRLALSVATVASPPNSLTQLAVIALSEAAMLHYWLFFNPFARHWIAFLTQVGSIHQVAQLGLTCFNRAAIREDPTNTAFAVAMWWLFVGYLAVFVLVTLVTVVFPALHPLIVPNPVEGATRRLEALLRRARTLQTLYEAMPCPEAFEGAVMAAAARANANINRHPNKNTAASPSDAAIDWIKLLPGTAVNTSFRPPPVPPVQSGFFAGPHPNPLVDTSPEGFYTTSAGEDPAVAAAIATERAMGRWVAAVRALLPPTEHLTAARRAFLSAVGGPTSAAVMRDEMNLNNLKGSEAEGGGSGAKNTHYAPRQLPPSIYRRDLSRRALMKAMPTEVLVVRQVIAKGRDFSGYWPPSSSRTLCSSGSCSWRRSGSSARCGICWLIRTFCGSALKRRWRPWRDLLPLLRCPHRSLLSTRTAAGAQRSLPRQQRRRKSRKGRHTLSTKREQKKWQKRPTRLLTRSALRAADR